MQLDNADDDVRARYEAILAGAHRDGPAGRVSLCLSHDRLDTGRGDVVVGLGLASALVDRGWGVSVWPSSRWSEPGPVDVDVAMVFAEDHVPGLIPDDVRVVAWTRNWIDQWAAAPYLASFSAIWSTSAAGSAVIAERLGRDVPVVPLATNPDLFRPRDVERADRLVVTSNFWGVERGTSSVVGTFAATEPVTWFGANGEHLERLPSGVEHGGLADYFSLPWVHSGFRFTLDDVIGPAARYGNQNSRLFDALATGSLVVTNTAAGLDDLGLGDVPVYADGDDLVAIVAGLRADPAGTAALATRLQEVVRTEHTWTARAEQVDGLLRAVIDAPDPRRPSTDLLRFATETTEARRALADRLHHSRDEVAMLRGLLRESDRRLGDALAFRDRALFRAASAVTRPFRRGEA